MDEALVVTADPALTEELTRLAAAAGVEVAVRRSATEALPAWAGAAAVLVGADLAPDLAALSPPRRAGAAVITWLAAPQSAYRAALRLGAEQVVELPAGAATLTETLTDLDLPGELSGGAGASARGEGALVGVVGGSGGAGATTFACALGQVAARAAPALVVDLDPLGPGCDRVLALERLTGVRWDGLARASGRLSARSLRDAVPRGPLGPGVLGFSELARERIDPVAAREAISAARRGHRTVVVDLPRSGGEVACETAIRCTLVVLVCVPTMAGVAAAARWAAADAAPERIGLLVRGRGADAARVADLVGVPLLAQMADQRGITESVDLGLGPLRSGRGPLARAAAEVLARVGEPLR